MTYHNKNIFNFVLALQVKAAKLNIFMTGFSERILLVMISRHKKQSSLTFSMRKKEKYKKIGTANIFELQNLSGLNSTFQKRIPDNMSHNKAICKDDIALFAWASKSYHACFSRALTGTSCLWKGDIKRVPLSTFFAASWIVVTFKYHFVFYIIQFSVIPSDPFHIYLLSFKALPLCFSFIVLQ